MSVSLNSPSDSTNKEAMEEVADLTLNHDEALDLTLALGALGGLRHSAACDATERSQRRYDDRNHRMHETRMKTMGMEGEEKEPEADDMSQQVLIRSPIIHNHYANGKPQTQQPQQPGQPAAQTGMSPTMKAILGTLVGTSLLGPAMGGWALYNSGGGTVINQPIEKAPGQNIGTLPPIPPEKSGGS